jgi:glycosyltransferase involved in cell wall biosynthesis
MTTSVVDAFGLRNVDHNLMTEKLASIIIPAYNVEKYISACLNSVIGQSYKNIEIIIVNDGSTDTTTTILDHYQKKDSRIQIVHKINGGLASARNAGLAVARGEYLFIFDSDDCMLPEKVTSQVAWLEQHPAYDVVYSDLVHFFDGTTKTFHLMIRPLESDQYKTLLKGNCINPNTICMRRTVYINIGGFDETLRSAEDWEYWLRITRAGIVFGYQPEILTLYRMRKNSLSADHIVMNNTALRVIEKQREGATADHRVVIEEMYVRWNAKLALARKKNTAMFYTIVSFIVMVFRHIKHWIQLKKIYNARYVALLHAYDTH